MSFAKKNMSLRGTKQSHLEKLPCKVRDCFVPRNDNLYKTTIVYKSLNAQSFPNAKVSSR